MLEATKDDIKNALFKILEPTPILLTAFKKARLNYMQPKTLFITSLKSKITNLHVFMCKKVENT